MTADNRPHPDTHGRRSLSQDDIARIVQRDVNVEAVSMPTRISFALPLGLLSLVVIILVAASIVHTVAHHKEKEVSRLQAIAELKSAQVSGWLGERRGDAEFLRSSTFLAGLYAKWQDQGATASRDLMLSRLGQFRKAHTYNTVLLLDRNGEPLWDSEGSLPSVSPALRMAVRQALAETQVITAGPYRDAADALHLDFIAPLPVVNGRPGPVVVLRADPAASLFPMLQAWPTPSASGESLLFRRDGDSALFLNGLRHRQETAAKLRIPMSEKHLLAAQVLNAEAKPGAVVEGVDYRLMPVVGVVQAVAGTDWYLVAKLDLEEAHAEGRRDSMVIGLAGALALFVAVVAALLFRQRQELLFEQRRRAEQGERLGALQLLDAIAGSSTDAIFAKDLEGRYLLFNREAARVTGQVAADVVGRTDHGLFPPDEAEAIRANDRQAIAENRAVSFEENLTTVDGEVVFLATKGPLHDAEGGVIGLFGISRDITAIRRAEQSLKESEARYRAVVDNAADAVLVAAPEGRLLYANRQAAALLGYDVDQLHALGVPDIVPPGGVELAIATFERLKELGHLLVEAQLKRRDGGVVPVEVNAVRLPDGNLYGACRDITERKQAEARLQASEERLQLALNATSDGLWDWDSRSGLAYLTPRYYEMTGYRADEVTPDFEFFKRTVHPDDLPHVLETMEAHMQGKTQISEFDYRLVTPSGTIKWMRGRGRVVERDAEGAPLRMVGTITDISARKAAEEALLRQTEELSQRNAELERFNRAMVGRELDMIALKQQVNELSRRLGQEPPYPLVFLDASKAGEAT